jgi:hypothetical protein
VPLGLEAVWRRPSCRLGGGAWHAARPCSWVAVAARLGLVAVGGVPPSSDARPRGWVSPAPDGALPWSRTGCYIEEDAVGVALAWEAPLTEDNSA